MPGKRVIIADDALDFARMLQATLLTVDTGIKTIVVPSAEEAMLEAARLPVDLLVTDVRLPGMNGFELVRKVRVRSPNMRIIVVTGLKDPTMEMQARQSGADRFFIKPLSISEFIATVQDLLALPPAPLPVAPAPLPVEAREEHPVHLNGSITAALTNLRHRLGAQAVLLADARGRVAAQAGDFETPGFAEGALPGWMAALSAAEKVARALGPAPSAQVYRGDTLELVLAPVGEMTLAIALKPGRAALRAALAVEEALEMQKELRLLLEEMGVEVLPAPVVPAAPPPVEPAQPALPEVEEDLGDLETLLAQPASALPAGKVDAFWEQAAVSIRNEPASPEALSYEQAQRLGLAPQEE